MSPSVLLTRSESASPATDALGVAVGSLDTPIGTLHVAATSAGLVRMGFGAHDESEDLMSELAGVSLTEEQGDPAWLDEPMGQLREYFGGSRQQFDVAMDWRLSHGFYRRVLDALAAVGYGETVSYGELALMADAPGAARAVGTAMSTNPIPVIVPCHRVVRSDGSVGQYGGGAHMKTWLLEHERSHCKR